MKNYVQKYLQTSILLAGGAVIRTVNVLSHRRHPPPTPNSNNGIFYIHRSKETKSA